MSQSKYLVKKRQELETIVIPKDYMKKKEELKGMMQELQGLQKKREDIIRKAEIEELKRIQYENLTRHEQSKGSLIKDLTGLASVVLPHLTQKYIQSHNECDKQIDCTIQQFVRGYSVRGYYREIRGIRIR